MNKYSTIMTIGVFTALMPFLGFPRSWETFFYVIFGVSISAIAFALKRGSVPPNGVAPEKKYAFPDERDRESIGDTPNEKQDKEEN